VSLGPAPRNSRRALARLIAGHVCLHASMAGMRMAAPLLALREGYGPIAVGVLLALFATTQVFLALPAGRYADRNGLKKPMGWAVIAASLGCAFAVVFPVFGVLCLTAIMTGGATGVASISMQRHVGRAAADATELKKVFSWLAIGPAISNFVGPFSAGLLIDYAGVWLGGQAADTNGFRGAFLLMALLPLTTWAWIRHTVELPPVITPQNAPPKRAWDLLRQPMMRRLMIVNLLLASCWDVHTFVVPVIGHELGFSASVIGTILGAFAVSATLIRVVLPMVASRIHEWAVLAVAMGWTALLFAIYPFLTTPLAMGICSVLLGLGLGAVQPMVMSTLHQITPEARQGEALGLRLVAINGCSVVMPLLFGTMGTVVGVSLVFWVVGAAVGLGARLGWTLRPAPPTAAVHGGAGNTAP
jgi:MFS family permease